MKISQHQERISQLNSWKINVLDIISAELEGINELSRGCHVGGSGINEG